MEPKRLIPYSVHLPEDVYKKLKAAAGERKASALVRDAITIIVEGTDEFSGGYNKAIRDATALINDNQWCSSISIQNVTIADYLASELDGLIIQPKGKSNGNKKTKV